MILHAAAIAALLADQIQQTPVAVQCAQAAPEPEWKWWLGALAPWVGPLLSGVVSIYVAWKVFHWQGKKEHKQWVLDNKKTEWKALLEFASKVEQFMPSVATGSELTKTVHDPLFREHLRDMTEAALKCVFISKDRAEKIYNSLLNIQVVNEQSKGHIEDYNLNANHASALGKPRPLIAAKNVQSELASLWREIRQFAAEDMELERRDSLWESAVGWPKKETQARN